MLIQDTEIKMAKQTPDLRTVRHVLDDGLLRRAVLEANRVADLLSELAPKLFGHTLGDRHGRDLRAMI